MRERSQSGGGVAGQRALRRHNLALVLGSLRDDGPRSRARLAADLGLNKATVSSLVTELLERGLVREGGAERGAVGRPGTTVEIDGSGAFAIGAEINVHHASTLAVDLRGTVLSSHRESVDTRGQRPEQVLDTLVALLQRTLEDLRPRGATPVALVVGVAGLVDHDRGAVTLAPNLGWREVPVRDRLVQKLGRPDHLVEVVNEANLAAVAEATPGDPTRRDILVVHGEVGIGGGVVADGRLLPGRRGYAGEFGHIVVDPGGRRCGCGRTGCWETVIGLSRLLELAADEDDPLRAADLRLDERVAEINRRAEAGDERTLAALREVGRGVGAGAVTLANAFNPGLIVLSGYLAEVGSWFVDVVEAELADGVLAPEAGGTGIALSSLGTGAAVRGGAALAIEHVYDDPTLVPRPAPPRALGATS